MAKGKKKVNAKFIDLPWTPKVQGRWRRTQQSQFFVREADEGYSPILAIDPKVPPKDTDVVVFDAWYHKHLLAFKEYVYRLFQSILICSWLYCNVIFRDVIVGRGCNHIFWTHMTDWISQYRWQTPSIFGFV